MSIYDKQISSLTTDDLQELLDEQAIENIRLEFKREAPGKDETLKKLSSFANTYGGYLVIGAEADNSGHLQGLPGVIEISGFKQRIVQWCYESIYPPVQPFVSEAIPSPQNSTNVCYVIVVEESEEAPHFLNSRKGVYVRTDEFSQKFEPQLATFEEIQHLSNRRALCEERRDHLFERAERRFLTHVQLDYKTTPNTVGDIGTTLKLALVPRYPAAPLADETKLLDIIGEKRVSWRQVGFPSMVTHPLSQHESALILNPVFLFSFFQADIWGHLYYAAEVERVDPETGGENSIHTYSMLGYLLVFLEHARVIYEVLGYNGTLNIHFCLEHVLDRHFWRAPQDGASIPASCLDDTIEFFADSTGERLHTDRNGVARDLIRRLFFAANVPWVAKSEQAAQQMISYGYTYNMWKD